MARQEVDAPEDSLPITKALSERYRSPGMGWLHSSLGSFSLPALAIGGKSMSGLARVCLLGHCLGFAACGDPGLV